MTGRLMSRPGWDKLMTRVNRKTPSWRPGWTGSAPELTAARTPPGSWSAPSTSTSAAVARGLRQDHWHFRCDQDPRPATQGVNSGFSGSSKASVTRCNDSEEGRPLLDLRPQLLGVAAQGAELLLRQVPRASSALGLQEGYSLNLKRNARRHWVSSLADVGLGEHLQYLLERACRC